MKNKLVVQLSLFELNPSPYNLSQHYYETQSNVPTGKVSMNKILENAHLCLAFLQVHCD